MFGLFLVFFVVIVVNVLYVLKLIMVYFESLVLEYFFSNGYFVFYMLFIIIEIFRYECDCFRKVCEVFFIYKDKIIEF